MRTTLHLLGLALGVCFVFGVQGRADTPDDNARLREALRSAMQQLQDTQSQLANLQAAQNAQADDRKALADQLALMKKHAEEDRAAAATSLEKLKAQVAAQEKQIELLNASYIGWKAAAGRADAEASQAAAERDQAQYQAVLLQRKVDSLLSKNLALYELGNDILTRYEKFGLGEQFLAKEPFIGRARVRLENLIQDYGDKLLAQRADQ